MFGDVLVHLGDDDPGKTRLEQAIRIADRLNASLTGLQVLARPDGDGPRRESAFTNAVRGAPIPVRQLTVVGPEAAAICAQARYADLVVISRLGADAPEEPHGFTLAEQVARGCGRPVLVAPDRSWSFSDRRILLAWDGSREAVRALHDALPLLRRAEQVEALMVFPDGDPRRTALVGDGELKNYLVRHGVEERRFGWAERSDLLSAAVAEEIEGGGFDLLVMGAYGEPAWIEGFRSGATSEVLRRATTPVFLSN